MILDASKYLWSKWQQPIFTGNDTWGTVAASAVHKVSGQNYEPFCALDGNEDTHFEGPDYTEQLQYVWKFDKPAAPILLPALRFMPMRNNPNSCYLVPLKKNPRAFLIWSQKCPLPVTSWYSV